MKIWLAILSIELRIDSISLFQEILKIAQEYLVGNNELMFEDFANILEVNIFDFECSRQEFSEIIRYVAYKIQVGKIATSILTKKRYLIALEKIIKFDIKNAFSSWLSNFENDIKLTTFWCTDYPKSLRAISYPPVTVSYYGMANWNQDLLLSIVGSRQPSTSSKQWLESNLPELIKRNIRFVSGGARGVDQIAHEACWLRGYPTYVFLPSGLMNTYPSEWDILKKDVAESGGAIFSEYAPRTTIQRAHFWQRNRLISGFSKVTLIVEARRKSGTLLTAKHAIDQNRDLAVVPHTPSERGALGSLDLLFEGANLVRDYKDILGLMGMTE